MELKRVGVLSAGKVLGVLWALIGLLSGIMMALVSSLGLMAWANDSRAFALLPLMLGVGAVFFMPVFYGIVGFIGGVIAALLYNLVARIAGGLELEFTERAARRAYDPEVAVPQ
jgi:uncharacterized membrane protein